MNVMAYCFTQPDCCSGQGELYKETCSVGAATEQECFDMIAQLPDIQYVLFIESENQEDAETIFPGNSYRRILPHAIFPEA